MPAYITLCLLERESDHSIFGATNTTFVTHLMIDVIKGNNNTVYDSFLYSFANFRQNIHKNKATKPNKQADTNSFGT